MREVKFTKNAKLVLKNYGVPLESFRKIVLADTSEVTTDKCSNGLYNTDIAEYYMVDLKITDNTILVLSIK